MERATRLGLLVAAALVVSLLASGGGPVATATDPDSPALVEPRPNASALWPYTSKDRTVDQRTLAINVVVYGPADRVRRTMQYRTAGEWQRSEAATAVENDSVLEAVAVEDGTEWRDAHGSTRYTYVDAGGAGTWVDESYQLHDGDYLGARYHVRAYESPDPADNWTAMQAHKEHWDWFRLRHTVTSVKHAQQYVEADFMGERFAGEVRRVHYGNSKSSDSDGWTSVIELALATALAGIVASTSAISTGARRRAAWLVDKTNLREWLLFGSMVAVYLGVRVAGIALERAVPGISPKVFAGLLYPCLALGLPLCAYVLGRRLELGHAFAFAAVGLATAVLADYAYVGLAALPIPVLLHRVILVLSIGLVAAGAAYRTRADARWNQLLVLGVGGWLAALVFPLAGVV